MQSVNNCANIDSNPSCGNPSYAEPAEQLAPIIATYLENFTEHRRNVPSQKGGDTDVAYKINQPIVIDGSRHWIRANTMQEFADKVLSLGRHAPETVPPLHTIRLELVSHLCRPQYRNRNRHRYHV